MSSSGDQAQSVQTPQRRPFVAAAIPWIPWILATLILGAAVSKICSLSDFSWFVSTIAFIPERYRDWLTLFIPLCEIVVGCLLLHPASRRAGLYACLGMLLAFSGFIIVLMIHPYAPSCDCFGAIKLAKDAKINNRIALVRNGILLALTVWGIRSVRARRRIAVR